MATQVQNRRGTTAEHSTFTGANGELTVDTTKRTLVVHDGATAGGRPLLREDQSNLPTSAPTTGIYNASGSLAISTNSTGRLFVDSSGRVGIGAASPSYFLHLNGSSNVESRAVTSGASSTAQWGAQNTTGATVVMGAGGSSYSPYGAIGVSNAYVYTGSDLAIATDGANVIKFATGAGVPERMRLDSSGRLGIGTSSVGDTLHVKGSSTYGGVIADNSAATGGGAFRAYRNGVQKAIFCADSWVTGTSSDDAAIYADAGGGIKFYTNNSSTAKAVLTSGGSLGIGTTGPSSPLHISADSETQVILNRATTTTGASFLRFTNLGGSYYIGADSSIGNRGFATGGAPYGLVINAEGAYPITFGTTNIERARIDSSGRLLVGTSTAVGNALIQVQGGISINGVTNTSPVNSAGHYISPVVNSGGENTCKSATNDTSGSGPIWNYSRINTDGPVFRFHRGTTEVGSVSITSSATAYNTSSDYRLKENVAPVTDGITRLQQLKPSRFNFIVDPDAVVDGFIAHEVQDVVPEAIHGTKDEVDADGNPVYQGIDQSKLVPLLTAALQEAIGRIEQLEATVATLQQS